jgi:hypothetical protein
MADGDNGTKNDYVGIKEKALFNASSFICLVPMVFFIPLISSC